MLVTVKSKRQSIDDLHFRKDKFLYAENIIQVGGVVLINFKEKRVRLLYLQHLFHPFNIHIFSLK